MANAVFNVDVQVASSNLQSFISQVNAAMESLQARVSSGRTAGLGGAFQEQAAQLGQAAGQLGLGGFTQQLEEQRRRLNEFAQSLSSQVGAFSNISPISSEQFQRQVGVGAATPEGQAATASLQEATRQLEAQKASQDRVQQARDRIAAQLADQANFTEEDTRLAGEAAAGRQRQIAAIQEATTQATTQADLEQQARIAVEQKVQKAQQQAAVAEQILANQNGELDAIKQATQLQQQVNRQTQGGGGGGFFGSFRQGLSGFGGGSPLENLGQQLGQQVFFGGTFGIGIRIASSIRDAIEQANQLDRQLTILQSQFEATDQSGNFSQFRSSILDISRNTGLAGTEVATLAREFLGLYGNATQAATATQSAAELIRIIGVNAQQAAPEIAAVAQDLGVSVQQIGNTVLDLQDKTGRAGADMLSALSRVAPVAQEVNLNLQQTGNLLTTLSRGSALSGQQLGEGLARTLPQLVQKLPKVEIDTGIQFDPAAFTDANVALRQLLGGWNDLTAAQQQLAVSDLGGPRFAQIWAAALANPNQALKDLNNTQTNANLLAERNAAAQNTLQGAMDRMRATLVSLGEEITHSGFTQFLKDTLNEGAQFVSWIQDLIRYLSDLNGWLGGFPVKLAEVLTAMKALQVIAGSSIFVGFADLLVKIGEATARLPGLGGVGGGISGIGGVLGGGQEREPKLSAAAQLEAGAQKAAETLVEGNQQAAEALRGGGAAAEGSMTAGGATAEADLAAGGATAEGELAAGGAASAAGGAARGVEQLAFPGLEAAGGVEAAGTSAAGGAAFSPLLPIIIVAAAAKATVDAMQKRQNDKSKALLEQFDKESTQQLQQEIRNRSGAGGFTNAVDSFANSTAGRIAVDIPTLGLAEVARHFGFLPTPPKPIDQNKIREQVLNERQASDLQNQYQALIQANVLSPQDADRLSKDLQNAAKNGSQKALDDAKKILADAARTPGGTNAINSAQAVADINKQFSDLSDTTGQTISSAQDLKNSYDAGDITFAQYIAGLKQLQQIYANIPGAKNQADAAKTAAQIVKEMSKNLLDQAQFTVETMQAFGTDTPQDEAQVWINLLQNPQFGDLTQRLQAAKTLTGLLKKGVTLTPEQQQLIRDVYSEETLTLTPGGQDEINALTAAAQASGQSGSKVTDQIIDTATKNGETINQAGIDWLKAQEQDAINLLTAMGDAAAGNSTKAQALRAAIASDDAAIAALQNGPQVKPVAGTPGAGSQADQAKQQQQIDNAKAEYYKALAGDDPVKAALAEQRAAQAELAAAQKAGGASGDAQTQVEYWHAMARVQQADNALEKAEKAISTSRLELLKAQLAGDPVGSAEATVQEAQQALANAEGDVARNQAMAQLVKANQDLIASQENVLKSQLGVIKARETAGGDPVAAAMTEVQILQSEIAARLKEIGNVNPAGDPTYNDLQAQLIAAQQNVASTQISTMETRIRNQLDLNRITVTQAVQQLQQLKSLTQSKDQQDQIDIEIKNLLSRTSNLQFNLPTNVALPTLYEARRLAQTPTGSGYTDARNININLAINNGMDQQTAQAFIAKAVGIGAGQFGSQGAAF